MRSALINEQLKRAPDLPHQDPVSTGWLLGIMPTNLEQEISALTVADLQHRFS